VEEDIMQLREILRIKGNLLVTIAPEGMVSDGVSVMSEKDIGSLVVMSQGRLVGMLTFREVELRSTMLEHHIRYMPVMEGDTLVGVLSFHDVARAVLEEQAFENRMLKGYIKDSPT
jgi:CBS domain-containing protein